MTGHIRVGAENKTWVKYMKVITGGKRRELRQDTSKTTQETLQMITGSKR